MSWWPQKHSWEDSNADLGYWTRGNEGWFNRRILGIRAGHFEARNAQGWRTALNLTSKTKRLKRRNEEDSFTFLQSLSHN